MWHDYPTLSVRIHTSDKLKLHRCSASVAVSLVWAINSIAPAYVNVTRLLNIVFSSNACFQPYAVTSLRLSECRINDQLWVFLVLLGYKMTSLPGKLIPIFLNTFTLYVTKVLIFPPLQGTRLRDQAWLWKLNDLEVDKFTFWWRWWWWWHLFQ